MKPFVELLGAVAQLLWPVIFGMIVFVLFPQIRKLAEKGSEIAFEGKGFKLEIKPSKVLRAFDSDEKPPKLPDVSFQNSLPGDYYFINHTSFLRPEKQEEFQSRTGVKWPHYDIRVIVDSYYEGALERIDRVEYILNETYPNPIQVRTRKEDKFLLKELANGEYVLLAKAYMKENRQPIILQRYITLWKEGPKIDIA